MDSRRLSIVTAVVLIGETMEQQSDTCVFVGLEVNLDNGHNSSKARYVLDVTRRLNEVEDQMRDIKETIVAMDNKISTIDNSVSVVNNTVPTANGSSIETNVSATYMSNMELLHWQIFRERLVVCMDITKVIDQDTAAKCMTMQMGVRNGRSVSVHTWVIEDYNSKVGEGLHYSQPFYHTVPGYKYRLRMSFLFHINLLIYLELLPGEYDDQLEWPFSQKHNLTVLTNDGLEAPHRTFSGEQSTCRKDRPTYPTNFDCYSYDAKWADVYVNKTHILDDGSVVGKLYFYN